MKRGTSESVWPAVEAADLASEVPEAMSSKTPADKTATTESRRIETGRLTKALSEGMTVDIVAPGMYDITHDGEIYTIDVEGGSCGCKDYQYRGDEYVCKHAIRASITHAFRSEPNTQLVARVLAAVRERGCIHDTAGCAGPTQAGERGFPCEECIAATPGHWTAYCRLEGHDEWLDSDPAPVMMADGGTATRLDAADYERETHRNRPGSPRCDCCGECDPLGRDLVEADWCAEFERVCSECLVDHGPLDCEHETPSESKWADMEGI